MDGGGWCLRVANQDPAESSSSSGSKSRVLEFWVYFEFLLLAGQLPLSRNIFELKLNAMPAQ